MDLEDPKAARTIARVLKRKAQDAEWLALESLALAILSEAAADPESRYLVESSGTPE